MKGKKNRQWSMFMYGPIMLSKGFLVGTNKIGKVCVVGMPVTKPFPLMCSNKDLKADALVRRQRTLLLELRN